MLDVIYQGHDDQGHGDHPSSRMPTVLQDSVL